MNIEQVFEVVSSKIRLIRLKRGYSQDKMSEILGISKKLLFKLKKDVLYLEENTVAVCSLFRLNDLQWNIYNRSKDCRVVALYCNS